MSMQAPDFVVDQPTHQVLETTACLIGEQGDLEVRFQVVCNFDWFSFWYFSQSDKRSRSRSGRRIVGYNIELMRVSFGFDGGGPRNYQLKVCTHSAWRKTKGEGVGKPINFFDNSLVVLL